MGFLGIWVRGFFARAFREFPLALRDAPFSPFFFLGANIRSVAACIHLLLPCSRRAAPSPNPHTVLRNAGMTWEPRETVPGNQRCRKQFRQRNDQNAAVQESA